MADNEKSRGSQQQPGDNPDLKSLDLLVGRWIMKGSHPVDPTLEIGGSASFEWLKGGAFLVQRWDVDHPDFPGGIAIISRDDTTGDFTMHYFDSRGVARVYNMSLRNGVWTLWRHDPDFAQRFTGTFSDNGNTITGAWERSSDGTSWEHDFDLSYEKDSQAE